MNELGWHLLMPFFIGAGIGVVIITITLTVLGWNEERKFKRERARALLKSEHNAAIRREMKRGGIISNANDIIITPGSDGLIREVVVPFGQGQEFTLRFDDGMTKDQIKDLTIGMGRGIGLIGGEQGQETVWDEWRW